MKQLLDATVQAASDARTADQAAIADRKAAAEAALAERVEANRERIVRKVERIGELVEFIFWTAGEDRELEQDPRRWWYQRNLLSQLIIGLRERLPRCAELLDAHSSGQAFGGASRARTEVELELRQLYGEINRIIG